MIEGVKYMRLHETFNIHKKINSIFPFFKSKYLCKKGIHCYILNIQDTVIPHYYKEENATHRRIVSKIIEYEHIYNTNLKCLCCGKEVGLEEEE